MKVLHLPYNIANFATITVEAINESGHQAKGLILTDYSALHNNTGLKIITPKKGVFNKIKRFYHFMKALLWADVIHWYFDEKILPNNLALKIIKWLKKPAVVEWLGSDIRNPLIEFIDNPYFKEAYPLFYDLPAEQIVRQTIDMQKRFAAAGFETILCADMQKYVHPNTFKHENFIRQRINLSQFKAAYPSKEQTRPVIVHAPSKKDVKGTHFVLAAIELVKAEHLDFDFQLIHNQTHAQALKAMQNCDIYIDQFIVGSYGMAAIEAMAFGKPVVTYIKEANWADYPQTCPLVNTTGDGLADSLRKLVIDATLRHDLGVKSRVYIAEFHSTEKVIPDLLHIYEEVIDRK